MCLSQALKEVTRATPVIYIVYLSLSVRMISRLSTWNAVGVLRPASASAETISTLTFNRAELHLPIARDQKELRP